jgi:uncharacterized membrane protein
VNTRRTILELVILISAGSLVALMGLQCFLFAPLATPLASGVVFVAQSAPIAAVLPALLARRSRAPLWMALVSLLYFVHGIARVTAPAERVSGAFEIVFALALLAACLALARSAQRG